MKNTLLTMGVFASLVASANAFSIDFTTLTGDFGTRTFNYGGYMITVAAAGTALNTTDISTSSFGIVLDPGEELTVTFAPLSVTSFNTSFNPLGANGNFTGSNGSYTISNTGGAQTATFVTGISGDSIPEPTSAALLALGVVGFAARRRK